MQLTAVHGDGSRRIKFEYRPTTWISHGVQALCGIQTHKVLKNGSVRPGLYYKGWRWNVQKACMRLQSLGGRWI